MVRVRLLVLRQNGGQRFRGWTKMPLSVDSAGLRQGAGRSVDIAAGLAKRGDHVASSGHQPSHAGVAALIAAVTDVRTRQAQRVERSAADLLIGADAHDATDAQAGGRLAKSV